MTTKNCPPKGSSLQYDVFISHSSQDKEAVARPLAQALEDRGLQVWLDEEQLQIGDSIRRGIDTALRQSRFGLVVLSPAYLNSEWGQKELDAFFAKEKHNVKAILPLYHGISIESVEQHWPMLADKISLNTTEGIEQLANKIQQSVKSSPSKPARLVVLKNNPWWPSNNWQWLIGIILALAAIVIPIWHSTSSPSGSGAVNITGDMSGGIVIGNQTTHLNIGSKAAELIAKSLLQGSKQASDESLQEKDAEIKRLTKTIARLQQQPDDELKQSALKKLEEDKPEEAAQLLKQSLVKRGKALQLQSKKMAEDWVDVGNIAYLNNTREALDAYSKAAALDPANIEAWNQLGRIKDRLGNLDESIRAYETVLTLVGNDPSGQAVAYTNLGVIYKTKGELDKAEAFHHRALKINETLGHQEGIAIGYGNLSGIYLIRGELGKAEAFTLKALKIREAIGRQEGLADHYSNLGVIYQTGGKLNKAEESTLEALKISEAIDYQGGIATGYGNLGLIYQIRGELDKAEAFTLKSLKINETLGHQESMAIDYGNLSVTYKARGDLDSAEAFRLKALKINEALGLQEGIAIDYGNLGGIYLTRGELKTACEHWLISRDLFDKVGSVTAQRVQNWIEKNCQL